MNPKVSEAHRRSVFDSSQLFTDIPVTILRFLESTNPPKLVCNLCVPKHKHRQKSHISQGPSSLCPGAKVLVSSISTKSVLLTIVCVPSPPRTFLRSSRLPCTSSSLVTYLSCQPPSYCLPRTLTPLHPQYYFFMPHLIYGVFNKRFIKMTYRQV